MNTIQRKQLLYRSGLGFFCINPVLGCAHGCRYPCYAFLMARRYGRVASIADWRTPRLVENAEELLEGELSRRRCKPQRVSLCLTTDPFMAGYPEVVDLSLRLIAILNRHGVAASVLTKGLLPPELAGHPYGRENDYGISMVSLDETFRRRFEPGAAPYRDRIRHLAGLHAAGCRTRVHMEPYPAPNIHAQEIYPLLEAVEFVDELYFGGWNYSSLPRSFPGLRVFYREQARLVRNFCDRHGIRLSLGLPD